MRLVKVAATGFRCFNMDKPLDVDLRPGLNVIVGENDSGKTALVDAIRLVLGTRGDTYLRLTEEDFAVTEAGQAAELTISCTLGDLSEDETASFLEWCVLEEGTLRLHVHLHAHLKTSATGRTRVWWERRTGTVESGLPVEGELREYLQTTYLRPLRDAERELSPGRRSRLAQILAALPEMAKESTARASDADPLTLRDILNEADRKVTDNLTVQEIEQRVNEDYLSKLTFDGEPIQAALSLGAESTIVRLLQRLELVLQADPPLATRVRRGLGMNNALFMAAELLLLQSEEQRMGTLLIEEPEAHLHPQLQSRFMQMLEARLNDEGAPQVIVTTHSPLLSASVDLNDLIVCHDAETFSLAESATALESDDYSFLRRFLDATKANLFFARGVVMVEGDAENLLLPALAQALGRDFTANAVSIVNVGHTGLFRYARIFQGVSNDHLPVPVACIGDRDIPPDIAKTDLYPAKHRPSRTESDFDDAQRSAKEAAVRKPEGGHVKVFISPGWTLEYDLAAGGLAERVHQAAWLARSPSGRTREELLAQATEEIGTWQADGESTSKIAARIYLPMKKKTVSKAAVAEQLAHLIGTEGPFGDDLAEKLPSYLVDAIKYVTTPLSVPAPEPSPEPEGAQEPQPAGTASTTGDAAQDGAQE